LSAQTVSVIVRSLDQEGLVSKGEALRGRVGPPTIPISLNPGGAYSIGVSFGAKALDVVVVDFVGNVCLHLTHRFGAMRVSQTSKPLHGAIEQGLSALRPEVRSRIVGIGLAIPDETSMSDELKVMMGLDWLEAERGIEHSFGLPVYIQNEITAAASGESLFGSARSQSDFVFFYLGSHLQSRLILNHQIYNGSGPPRYDVGLSQLNQAIEAYGLAVGTLTDTSEISVAASDAIATWCRRCCKTITDSVESLLQFVSVKSLVVSTYAPAEFGARICGDIRDALPGVNILLGGTTAPKAVGAASLSYHSRFMVQ